MEQTSKHNTALVSIIIVTWNAASFIRHTIDSLREQTFTDFDVLVIDNNSDDETVSILKNKYADIVRVVKQKNNTGFSKGYNAGIHWTRGKYVLVMNQDVILEPEYLEQVVAFMEAHNEVGAIQGKILHWNIAHNKKEKILDTCGISITKAHAFISTYEAENESVLPDVSEASPVFAFSASLVFLRRYALESVQYKQEFFDEDFYAYKEDIDLSWRLRHAHWDIVFLPTAVAYHGRTLSKSGTAHTDRRAIRELRSKQNPFLHTLSYQNHLLTIIKNQHSELVRKYFFSIFWFELQKCIYALLYERSTLKGWFGIIRLLPKIRAKRRAIFKKSKLDPDAMNSWIE